MRMRMKYLAPLVAIGLVVSAAACSSEDEGGGITEDPSQFPRAETLYSGGATWGTYTDFNPFTPGEVAYLRGFVYETLFEFDPWTAEVKPWLAESGEWVEDNVYEVKLRDGITWHDGEQLTADDVKFTFDQRDKDGVRFGELNEWIDEVTVVDDLTARFTFSDPRYGQWDYVLYDIQIAPEHTWTDKIGDLGAQSGDDIVTGSGPFEYHSHEDTRLRYSRYDGWWGTDALGLEMPMKYVVDFANESNEAAVAQITSNELDLSTFFLPNILELIEQNPEISTFYDSEPYMLSYNTASLIPNNTRAPLDDAELRRAMAFAINVQDIIENGYGNIVPPAHPTGLLPLWLDAGLVDQQVVDELGFSYDEAEANSILDDAGYAYDGDWRATPDGDPIELTFTIQAGWTDWEIAAEIIAENLQAVGLNVTVEPVEPSEIDSLRRAGEYDIVMYNWTQRISSHPLTGYASYYELPLHDPQPGDNNVQRIENERAWELTQQLAGLSLSDPATQGELQSVLSELQQISLETMTVIPMWHNGLWMQVNNNTWTNWPSDGGSNNYYCSNWGGVVQMGTIHCLAGLQSAAG